MSIPPLSASTNVVTFDAAIAFSDLFNSTPAVTKTPFPASDPEQAFVQLIGFLGTNQEEAALSFINNMSVAELNRTTEAKQTALHFACLYGLEAVIRELIKRCVDRTIKDEDENLALHLSLYAENDGIALLMIDTASLDEFNVINTLGYTALGLANSHSFTAAEEKITRIMQDPDAAVALAPAENVENAVQETPLENLHKKIATSEEESALSIIHQLSLQELNTPNSDGQTALHLACFHGCSVVVKELVNRGVDRTVRDEKGQSALDIAIEREQYRIAFILGLKD